MRFLPLILFPIGAGLLALLIAQIGPAAIGAALSPVGWGFVAVVAVHAAPFVFDVLGWRALFRRDAPTFGRVALARWIGEGVNALLPVTQLGAELSRIRILTLSGVDTARATAAVLADLTLAAASQTVFGILGAALLLAWFDAKAALAVLGGFAVLAAGIGCFYWLQRGGSSQAVWTALDRLLVRVGLGGRLDRAEPFRGALEAIYADRAATSGGFVFHLIGWVIGAVEIYVSLRVLGHDPDWLHAIILESLAQAGRSAAFAVPAGLGAQEASFLAVGTILGFDHATCLALALLRRGRDVVLGLPALACFWLIETRRSIAR